MPDIVLVHGAWHGSWCWKRVRNILAAGGHQVYTPTLTGLADRRHLLSRDVGLKTHVADVANLIEFEDLRDVVLVGHSYGGAVVTCVADQLSDRISSLIYLDAVVPEDGKSVFDYVPDGGARARGQAAIDGDGWMVSPYPASVYDLLSDADVALVDRLSTMHPMAAFEQAAPLSGAHKKIGDIGYVRGVRHIGFYDQFVVRARSDGWWVEEFDCGHEIMLDRPTELASLLVRRVEAAGLPLVSSSPPLGI
ncbi:MAG: alpha/beta hydrolase [Rhizobiaceae bacterium]|nr:alpha/beta hydrolase [Rhizobiaceae bacterium]